LRGVLRRRPDDAADRSGSSRPTVDLDREILRLERRRPNGHSSTQTPPWALLLIVGAGLTVLCGPCCDAI
jgi:hypothetical protein